MNSKELAAARQRISTIDHDLVALIAKRMD